MALSWVWIDGVWKGFLQEPGTSDIFEARVWCIPETGVENKIPFSRLFLFLSAVSRVQGEIEHWAKAQSPVETPSEKDGFLRPKDVFQRVKLAGNW